MRSKKRAAVIAAALLIGAVMVAPASSAAPRTDGHEPAISSKESPVRPYFKRYEAENHYSAIGDVVESRDIADRPEGMDAPLT